MKSPLDWSLIGVSAQVLLAASVLVLLVALLWVRRRSWWLRAVPISVAVALVVGLGGYLVVNYVWQPYPDVIPLVIFAWAGAATLVLCLSVARMRLARWPLRALMVLGVVWSLVVVAAQANIHYGAYTTTRALLGPLLDPSHDLSSVSATVTSSVHSPPGTPLEQVWQPPADMPREGKVVKASIPSSGGFKPREALIYLPPAYLSTPRAELPVLVVIPGDPGSPRQWIDAGHLNETLDQFAAQHKGLAPVVVMADHVGVTEDNPSCLDSPLGKPQTYLAKDVPDWVAANLQVSRDRSRWAIGGGSSGATCALLVALRAPQTYPNLFDLSGQREPMLASRKETVDRLFGGNESAYLRSTPKDIMARQKFPNTHALLIVGAQDAEYKPQQQEIFAAGKQAGMDIQYKEMPGGHTWILWREALASVVVPWLVRRMELIK